MLNDLQCLVLTIASSDGATYQSETDSIMARTKALSSEIQEQEPEFVAAFAGKRPSREGAPGAWSPLWITVIGIFINLPNSIPTSAGTMN